MMSNQVAQLRESTPFSVSSTFATPDSSPQPRPAMPRKQKRVVVTSCDTCRLRKLRCNAKELPKGTPCSNCTKHSIPCTFEDSKEHNRPLIRKKLTSNNVKGPSASAARANQRGVKGCATSKSFDQGADWTRFSVSSQGELPGPTFFNEPFWDGHPGYDAALAATSTFGFAFGSSPVPMNSALANFDSPARPSTQAGYPVASGPMRRPRLNSHGRSQSFTPELFHPYRRASASADLSSSGMIAPAAPVEEPGPWSAWSLPSGLTDPTTGQTFPLGQFQAVKLLLNRFYSEPTFLSIILPYEELFGRFEALLSVNATGHSTNGWSPLPEYLLRAVVSCGAASAATREPELRLWKQHAWQTALDIVNARLNGRDKEEIEMVQALLLLGICWMGEPESLERTITFEKAIKIACNLHLGSSKVLRFPNLIQQERSKRICLHWTVYVVDKLVAVARNRPSLVTKDSHDMPRPSIDDLKQQGCSNLTSHSSSGQDAQNQLYWTHNLALCYIDLAEILEDIQADLYPIVQPAFETTLDEVHGRIYPNEQKLEYWCKSNRVLMQTASEQGKLCRTVTEAIMAQLHLVQLQLYQRPLRLEVEVHEAQRRQRPEGMSDGETEAAFAPIHFSASNSKALTACIESAWHLVQQPVSPSFNPDSPFTSAARLSSTSTSSNSTGSSLQRVGGTSFAVLKATQFIRFLSLNWKGWDSGMGMLQYTPRFVVDSSSVGTNFRRQADGVDQPAGKVVDVSQPAGITERSQSDSLFEGLNVGQYGVSLANIEQVDPMSRMENDASNDTRRDSIGGMSSSKRRAAPPPRLNFSNVALPAAHSSKSPSPEAGSQMSMQPMEAVSERQSDSMAVELKLTSEELRSLDFSLTPARTLFDTSSMGIGSEPGHSTNGFLTTVMAEPFANESEVSSSGAGMAPSSSLSSGSSTFTWPGAANAMMTPLKSSFLTGSLDLGSNAFSEQTSHSTTSGATSSSSTNVASALTYAELNHTSGASSTNDSYQTLYDSTQDDRPSSEADKMDDSEVQEIDRPAQYLMAGETSFSSSSTLSWTDGSITSQSQSSLKTCGGCDLLSDQQQTHLADDLAAFELGKQTSTAAAASYDGSDLIKHAGLSRATTPCEA